MKRNYSLGFILVIMLTMMVPRGKTKIYLAGDSTMCTYEAERLPLMGWGMPFAGFFDSTITIDNRARGGRSTRTFISEGRWQAIIDDLAAGDFVLIQFGHNDEAKEEKYKDRYTPVNDYKANLAKMVNDTRQRKANPIIITPVSRMRFNDKGIAMETHTEYSAAAIDVAATNKVPVIDLDKMSRAMYEQMGPDATRFLFMQLDSMQHPNYPSGLKDNTHFSEYGARRIAELVLAGIRAEAPELSKHICKPRSKK